MYLPFNQQVLQHKDVKNQLLRICQTLSEDALKTFYLSCKYPTHPMADTTGIIFWIVKDEIKTVALVQGSKLDRIFTIPSARHKGYATNLLITWRLMKPTAWSPVNPEVVPLFEKVGFEVMEGVNKDGTINMACNKKAYQFLKHNVDIHKLPPDVIDMSIKMMKNTKQFNSTATE